MKIYHDFTWPLYLSAHAFQNNKRFGSLFLLRLFIDVILVKTGVYLYFEAAIGKISQYEPVRSS